MFTLQTQLENFITFMVQCSLGHDFNEVITEPQWWPKEVKFSNPLIRPKKITDVSKNALSYFRQAITMALIIHYINLLILLELDGKSKEASIQMLYISQK